VPLRAKVPSGTARHAGYGVEVSVAALKRSSQLTAARIGHDVPTDLVTKAKNGPAGTDIGAKAYFCVAVSAAR